MTGLNPAELGWQEFWVRLGALAFAAAFLVVAVAMALRLALHVVDGLAWLIRKARER